MLYCIPYPSIQTQLPEGSKAHNINRLEPNTVAIFLGWLILEMDKDKFEQGVFDIYDHWHQKYWNAGPLIMNPL